MWPRLVASKILKKRLGSNNFVADFPSNINSEDSTTPSLPENTSSFDDQPSLTLNSTIFNQDKLDVHKYKYNILLIYNMFAFYNYELNIDK